MTGVVRFLTIKEKLGWDQDPVKKKYSCYSCRHTFAHRMLSGFWTGGTGCSIETLAELLGSQRLTGAVLDRLTHHRHILEATGESYRLNDARKRSSKRKNPRPGNKPGN